MNNIKVVAVIPTFNRKGYLKIILNQLLAQNLKNEIELSIVVINDGSSDGTGEMLHNKFKEVNVVNGNGNWWYTRSIVEGIQYALDYHEPNFILTLNDDIEIGTNYLNEIIESVSSIPSLCIIGSLSVTIEKPHQITFSGVKKINWWKYSFTNNLPRKTLYDKKKHTGVVETKVLPGRGMLIPVKIIKEVGNFNLKYIQYNSDTEFCLRSRKHGYPVYVSYDAVVYSHHKLTDSKTLERNPITVFKSFFNKYSKNYIFNKIDNILKYGKSYTLFITVPIIILGTIKNSLLENK